MAGSLDSGIGVGLAPRVALFAWILALATLLIFVLLTIPQQKTIFLEQLRSKANSVAVALRDVAAGAAINEDFASVISASQTLLSGDPDLEFLVVTRNDGYSLVNRQSGWRVDTEADSYWLPVQREASGIITTVPILDEPVFHFAQPFDYSGIEWGWIHVGLSLQGYEQGVASVYRNTVILSIACILFSLVASLVYVRRLIRPVHRLREVVQRIAGGDLSVRADTGRRDELGHLADSINTMTEALLRRDRILESIRYAAQQFLRSRQWTGMVDAVLAKIGLAADVSRVGIFENQADADGQLHMIHRHEWVAAGIQPQKDHAAPRRVPYHGSGSGGLESWETTLRRSEVYFGLVTELSDEERKLLEPQRILALIVIPIFVDNQWWGFMRLDDCVEGRIWSEPEKDSLRAGADILGAAITRQRAEARLLEAKANLERRVQERTRELRDQVTAKEQALTELASTQDVLLDVSRAAGMAEVATGVLHNVGNVLNSVNVSCQLLMDQLRKSRIPNVAKVAELLRSPSGGLGRFLTEDAKGMQIPAYLNSLAEALREEQELLFNETQSLHDRVDHIKEIVTMQQNYGRVSGIPVTMQAEQLMEDAFKLNAEALTRHGVTVHREYQALSPIAIDKHKVLQILINLISNAKNAVTDNAGQEKVIWLRLFSPTPTRVAFQVVDSGVGIAEENLPRVFQHGFTTRQSGHGFGLHSGAIAARELGGRLDAQSDGPGLGATFTLELPCQRRGQT